MRIAEAFTCSKTGDPAANEDALWSGDRFCVVADGVTSKNNARFLGKTGGRIASECVISTVQTFSGDETAQDAFQSIQDSIRALDLPAEIVPQASVLIYSHKRRELWSVGDCPFILNGTYYRNEKKVDQLLSVLRQFVIEGLLMAGHREEALLQHDLAREMILPFLKLQSQFIGSDSRFSYSVVDGIHPIRDLNVIPVPEGSELILATDGYPDLKSTLAECEAALKEILKSDPLCYRLFPSTKGITNGNLSFDDRTFLKILT